MALPWTHSFFAYAVGKSLIPCRLTVRFWVLTVICAAIPDIDVFWRRLVANPAGIWGHRGITHSLPAAVVFGLLAACLCTRQLLPAGGGQSARRPAKTAEPPTATNDGPSAVRCPWRPASVFLLLWLAFTAATASHAMLDMLSTGYRGVALLAPFDDHRYSFSWQPIWYVPKSIEAMLPEFLTRSRRQLWIVRGALSEVVTVWAPMLALMGLSWTIRRLRRKKSTGVK